MSQEQVAEAQIGSRAGAEFAIHDRLRDGSQAAFGVSSVKSSWITSKGRIILPSVVLSMTTARRYGPHAHRDQIGAQSHESKGVPGRPRFSEGGYKLEVPTGRSPG